MEPEFLNRTILTRNLLRAIHPIYLIYSNHLISPIILKPFNHKNKLRHIP